MGSSDRDCGEERLKAGTQTWVLKQQADDGAWLDLGVLERVGQPHLGYMVYVGSEAEKALYEIDQVIVAVGLPDGDRRWYVRLSLLEGARSESMTKEGRACQAARSAEEMLTALVAQAIENGLQVDLETVLREALRMIASRRTQTAGCMASYPAAEDR